MTLFRGAVRAHRTETGHCICLSTISAFAPRHWRAGMPLQLALKLTRPLSTASRSARALVRGASATGLDALYYKTATGEITCDDGTRRRLSEGVAQADGYEATIKALQATVDAQEARIRALEENLEALLH